ncbi:MAG TPA: Fe2+-dependent dioxygenase [Gammaproteobacteria bacterium]|nr:Fe2+-dependent dioxygenase [Gammaproteobacteria bacterium]
MFFKIEGLLSTDEVARVRAALKDVKFVDGRVTAGDAVRDVKNNLQALAGEAGLDEARQLVNGALLRSEAFSQRVLPRQLMPALFNRYDPGMHYGGHVDNAIMGGAQPLRADVSVTVFLSEFGEYDGGALSINSDGEPRQVRMAAGGAVIYDATTIHRVEPVTRGSRLAAVVWCQSFVRDQSRREILQELAELARWAREVAPGSQEAMKVSKVRANLMRMWAEL